MIAEDGQLRPFELIVMMMRQIGLASQNTTLIRTCVAVAAKPQAADYARNGRVFAHL